jgi:hypothetical protein
MVWVDVQGVWCEGSFVEVACWGQAKYFEFLTLFMVGQVLVLAKIDWQVTILLRYQEDIVKTASEPFCGAWLSPKGMMASFAHEDLWA